MKKPLAILSLVLGVFLFSSLTAHAVSTFITGQGGTGTTSPSGILYGDNGSTTHLNTVTIGSNLTFSGGTLSATGGGGNAVSTSSSETSGYFPVWNTTSGTPALLVGTSSIFQSGTRLGIGTTTNLGTGMTIAATASAPSAVAANYPLNIISNNGIQPSGLLGLWNGTVSSGAPSFMGGIGSATTGHGLAFFNRDSATVFTSDRLGLVVLGLPASAVTGGNTNAGASQVFRITPGSWTDYAFEHTDFLLDGSTNTIGSTIANARNVQFSQPLITATTTNNSITGVASTVYIQGAPRVGGSATTSLNAGLYIDNVSTLTSAAATGYGLYVNAPTGAASNYAGVFTGGNVGVGTTSPYSLLSIGGNVVVGASSAGGTLGDLFLPKLGNAATTLLVANPDGKVTNVATSSASCGVGISCTGFTVVGSVSPSIALSAPVSIANGGTNTTGGAYGGSNQILAYTGTTFASYTGFNLTSTLLSATNASTTQFSSGVGASVYINSLGYLAVASSSPNFALSVGNAGKGLYVATTTGETVGYDAANAFPGRISPTHSFVLGTGTTTSWTASTTASAYSPFLAMPFAGTLQQVRCLPDASFLGVNVQVNGSNVTPSYFVASTTVGQEKFTAGNTFTAGQKILVNFGTTTTATATQINCTFDVTETP